MDDDSSRSGPLPAASNQQQEDKPPSKTSFWQSAAGWFKRAFMRRPDASLKEALEEVIEEHEEQAEEHLEPEEKAMLHNVLSFSDLHVSDIMIPRIDINAVPGDITLPALKAHIVTHRHTRVPVYEDTLDRVQGFVHVKDLIPMLSGDTPFALENAVRPLLFVPPSMPIIDLLIKMRHAGCHMAIVVDEYGGTDGLVTMEDLFEEIVGDIQDEHDSDEGQENAITRLGDHAFEVSARIRIETLEQELGLNLRARGNEGEFDTLGGLIFFKLGHVPVKGEIVPHSSGIRFEITDADPRRIRRVRILTA